MQVTGLADTDMGKYQYSIDGINYHPLQELEKRETFFGSQMVELHVRAVGSDNTIWQLAIVRLKLRETAAFRRFPVLTSFRIARM